MRVRQTGIDRQLQSYVPWLAAVCYAVVVTLLVWTAFVRYNDFENYHETLASSIVSELVISVEQSLIERQRYVDLFAEQHIDLIRSSALSPEDFDIRDELEQAISRFFPNFFAFTLTKADGAPLLEDYDGYVGDLCLADVMDFSQTQVNSIRVHPNAYVYHFDMMTQWGGDEGILMISFPADEITALLRASQAPGHVLSIIQPKVNHLIEITAEGARNAILRDDYRMSEEELSRVILSKPIGNTRWALIDAYAPGFKYEYLAEIIYESAVLILLLGLLTVIAAWMLYKNDIRRRRAELVKDEFVSVVSHELRTPLTSIQGSLSLLTSGVCGELSGKAKELFDIAANNAERLRLLVDDLLDMRKIETGGLELNLREVDIMDMIDKALVQNEGLAHRYAVRFVVRETVKNVFVDADPLRIGQVLSNLLSNAAKFSPPGQTVEIYVRCAEAGTVEIAIQDHGPGIDPGFESRLFEKFAQSDSTSARRHSGTGLGLAIVKALVEAHQGHVSFVSRPGVGSTFSFTLPVSRTTEV